MSECYSFPKPVRYDLLYFRSQWYIMCEHIAQFPFQFTVTMLYLFAAFKSRQTNMQYGNMREKPSATAWLKLWIANAFLHFNPKRQILGNSRKIGKYFLCILCLLFLFLLLFKNFQGIPVAFSFCKYVKH